MIESSDRSHDVIAGVALVQSCGVVRMSVLVSALSNDFPSFQLSFLKIAIEIPFPCTLVAWFS